MKAYSMILLLFSTLFVFTSCDEDDGDMLTAENKSIVDLAIDDPQFSTLVEALQRTDLVETLEGDGPFTVFAPTNEAFAGLGIDLADLTDQELTDILLYHVVPAQVRSVDLQEGQTYASTASTKAPEGNQLSVLIEKSGSGVTLNGASSVIRADISAENGVIHAVDQVIVPLDIVGHATANENFSELVNALTAAPGDLVNVLSSDGPFTVFAPLNSAFSAIESTISNLSPDQLTSVLTYHVVGGANVLSTALTDEMIVETVNGQSFVIDLDNGAVITDQNDQTSNIVLTDIQATNGVIHVIESVIIPSL